MSTTGPNLGLIEFATQGVVWYTEQNALERGLDGLVQAVAKDKDLATPPGSPANGDMYIVAGSPTGAWTAHATHLARYQNSDTVSTTAGWEFHIPKEGWRFYLQDEDKAYKFDGSGWVVDAPSATDISAGTLGLARGGTGVDLSATGSSTKVLAQDGSHVISARNLVAADLPSTAVTPASYGDGTHVGAFTVDAQGRLTAASSVTITGAAPTGAAGGDLAGTYPNPTFNTSVVTAFAKTFLDDAAASNVRTTLGLGTIAVESATAGGDLAGTWPSPTVAKIHETSGPTALTIGTLTDGEYLKRVGGTLVSGSPSGTGAPASSQYLTLALDSGLSAERVLTAGTGITFVDTGANGTLTISSISTSDFARTFMMGG